MNGPGLNGSYSLYGLCLKNSTLLSSSLLVFLFLNYLIYIEKIVNLLRFLLMRKALSRISEAYGLLSPRNLKSQKLRVRNSGQRKTYCLIFFCLLSEICVFFLRKRMALYISLKNIFLWWLTTKITCFVSSFLPSFPLSLPSIFPPLLPSFSLSFWRRMHSKSTWGFLLEHIDCI